MIPVINNQQYIVVRKLLVHLIAILLIFWLYHTILLFYSILRSGILYRIARMYALFPTKKSCPPTQPTVKRAPVSPRQHSWNTACDILKEAQASNHIFHIMLQQNHSLGLWSILTLVNYRVWHRVMSRWGRASFSDASRFGARTLLRLKIPLLSRRYREKYFCPISLSFRDRDESLV